MRIPLLFALSVGGGLSCAAPLQSLELSPMGHGAWSHVPGPRAIAWRANALSAPCALSCHARIHGDITCTCTSVDSIYFSRLDEGLRLGSAEAPETADGEGALPLP